MDGLQAEDTSSFEAAGLSSVVAACERFEARWRDGGEPRIEDFLEAAALPLRPRLLRELLAIEIELRAARGESPAAADYLGRRPDWAAAVDDVFSHQTFESRRTDWPSAPTAGPPAPDDRGPDGEDPPVGEMVDTVESPRGLAPGASAAGALPERFGRYAVLSLLGGGGFGSVYLARDEELGRLVAIKVLHPGVLRGAGQVEAFLAEARIAAGLVHPGIVRVYDVGRYGEGEAFVVFEYVEGRDLASLLKAERPAPAIVAGLMARIAEAAHHAHSAGLVHRDLKPSNILVDRGGIPHIADFGLAVRGEAQHLLAGEVAGTPAFMAPEQIRGETHRLDARTDVWALGVILYLALAGRQPFRGKDRPQVFRAVLEVEPIPPRRAEAAIPRELERIALKCLAKRMSDRYETAAELADDLNSWLVAEGAAAPAAPGPSGAGPATAPSWRATPTPPTAPIVPKGLRAFDPGDADFFPSLVPGPRDREGLPEAIRAWRRRIEEPDPARSFAVGLIYGPSGGGKSSFVRAGLLPRLARWVRPVYVEAVAEGTEARLLAALNREFPGLPAGAGLAEAAAALRAGRTARGGSKALVVLDQFEQWLHAHPEADDGDLVRALRQCDGAGLQALLLVRDDFWMAITRFLRVLEVRPIEGFNSAAVEPFDARHAARVLAELGRALGRLHDPAGPDEARFLERAVKELADPDGRIVPVRLTLLAEMLRHREWTPATLRELGGFEGIGMRFLEETFSAPAAPPSHRMHQRAAQAVLKALLPEPSSDLKGRMRPASALREAAGYAERPADFDELMALLDNELRMVTPADPEGVSVVGWRGSGGADRVGGGISDDRAERPPTGSLSARHGPGGGILSGDEDLPQRGAVRADEPDPAGGGVHTGQHRRGSGEGPHEGVLQPSEHRPGIAHGAGNPSDVLPEDRVGAAGGDRGLAGADRPHQQDAQRPSQGAGETPGNLNENPSSTLHPTPDTRIPTPSTRIPTPDPRYYQLTHDYLVPMVRQWLTRKQRETRHGRAELRLATITALWRERPESRRLPSLLEWLMIVGLTRSGGWSDDERRMMRAATRHHLLRAAAAVLVMGGSAWALHAAHERDKAGTLLARAVRANYRELPELFRELDEYRDALRPALRSLESDPKQSAHRRDVAGILLFRDGPTPERGRALRRRLMAAEAQPEEVDAIRLALAEHPAEAGADALRQVLGDEVAEPAARLRAACALQRIAPRSVDVKGLSAAAPAIAEALLAEHRRALPHWLDLLGPAAEALAPPLGAICRIPGRDASSRTAAAEALAEVLSRGDRDLALAHALVEAPPAAGRIIIREVAGRGLSPEARDFLGAVLQESVPDARDEGRKDELAARQSAAAIALAALGQPEPLWPMLRHRPDPRLRSLLIQRLAADGVLAHLLAERLSGPQPDPIECQALLLAWAESHREAVVPAARLAVLGVARGLYADDPHPGVHAAAWLLLRRWGDAEFPALHARLASARRVGPDGRGWEHGPNGHLLAILPAPLAFRMGTPEDECARFPDQVAPQDQLPHHRKIDRSLAVSMTEVTLEQFLAFEKDHPQATQYGGERDSPANDVDWFQAVRYCNWLSGAAKIDPRRWCYPEPTEAGQAVPGDAVEKGGFRLPTEAEWEYIARALTETAHPFGESQDLLSRHAWTWLNSRDRTHPVGRLLPNEFGMFDVLGNVWEWCHDGPAGAHPRARMPAYPQGTPESPAADPQGPQDVWKRGQETWRMLRGGAFNYSPIKARPAHRDWIDAAAICPHVGFRVVRTLPPSRGAAPQETAARQLDAGPSTPIARRR